MRGSRAILLLGLFACAAGVARAAAPPADWSHDLDVALDPNGHGLKARDRVTVGGEAGGPPHPRRLTLHAGMRITALTINGRDALAKLGPAVPGPAPHLSAYDLPATAPGARLDISYSGSVNDPVKSSEDLAFVTGDATTGLIGPEGIFLDSSTGWVASFGDELARYNVTARLPEPWRCVTQGKRMPSNAGVARYTAEVASDGLALVAGPYTVKSKSHKGVLISTYFFQGEADKADLFLDRTAEYLDRFASVLAPYPYSRFDIVENFFTTGYGYPSFTLLGRDVVQMGEQALRPGYVDHEIMHCWWGNFVYPDPAEGNWSEALTSYFANYLAQEAQSDALAADYRRNVSYKYSLRVKPSLDYPLSRFSSKKQDYENEIGYGKGSMVFHMIRRMTGDEVFFRVMRGLTEQFGGRRAGWSDIRRAFEKTTGTDFGWFFTQWIDRPGLPRVALGDIRVERAEGRFRVIGRILQEGTPWRLELPITVFTAQGPRGDVVKVEGSSAPFYLEVDAPPVEARLDPDMHVPRALRPAEMPPCLNAVLESDKKLFVLPAALLEATDDPYLQFAKMAAGTKGGEIIGDDQVKEGDLAGRSLLVFGRPDQNRVARLLLERSTLRLSAGPDAVALRGESLKGSDLSVLASDRNPFDAGHTVTFYFGLSPEALARARYAFYYGWDSFVIFRAGRPERRGVFDVDDPRSRRMLVSDVTGGPAGIDAVRLMDHVRALAGPEMEGRRTGTRGRDSAAAYIESQFISSGLAPASEIAPFLEGYRQSFTLALADLAGTAGPACRLRVKREEKVTEFDAMSLPFPARAPDAGDTDQVIFTDPEGLTSLALQPEGEPTPKLEAGIVFTVERPSAGSEEGGASLLAGMVRGAARLGAAALVILRPGTAPSGYASLISFPSSPSAQDGEKIESSRKSGDFTGADLYFSKRASQIPLPGPAPALLVLSAGPEVGVDLLGQRAYARQAAEPTMVTESRFNPILLDLEAGISSNVRRLEVQGVNMVGYLEGADPAMKKEAVLITAHYDALGRTEAGALLPGAADNAAGVAALLETARLFSDPSLRPRRSLLFAAFDGEEWGLAGSRALVARLQEVKVRPVAVVNIDSLGSTEAGRVYLIGGSVQPVMREMVRSLAAMVGLELGRDLDPMAFAYGSDYYPFHLAGIPAVGLFAANYRALHTAADSIDAVKPEEVAKAARLAALTASLLAR